MVDHDGNAVAVTYTINGGFGAGVIAPGTGFLLNDEMDDFTIKPGVANLFGLVQGEANAIAPGKRPLSSMAPTLIAQGRAGRRWCSARPAARASSPPCWRRRSTMIDYGMEPQEAVDAPRFHHQWLPDVRLRRALRLLA